MHPITNTFMLSKYNLIFLLLQQLAINVEPTIAPKPNKMCSPNFPTRLSVYEHLSPLEQQMARTPKITKNHIK
jgi:hypothetical protein